MLSSSARPDLSNRALLGLLLATALSCLLIGWLMHNIRPGEPPAQLAAIAGTLLLLVPVAFSVFKRKPGRADTPRWFVAHVLSAYAGCILIVAHAAGGSWFSPAVLILLALFFLVIQGTLARALLSSRLSQTFASSSGSFNHGKAPVIDRNALRKIIQDKQNLLSILAPDENEATFSPSLNHWLRQPAKAWRYQRLADQEAGLVGARLRAGATLRWWRRIHLLIAALFVLGITAHLVVMLLFAGYAAGENPIYWWHLADWG